MFQKGELVMQCNPDACPYCQYIGEGDSLCDKTGEIVLVDWEPTEHFMGRGCPYQNRTRREKRRGKADHKKRRRKRVSAHQHNRGGRV